MNDEKLRAILESLYVHVAAMPWKDKEFVRKEVLLEAAKSQIIEHTIREIKELEKESA